ncbi:MAG: SAM-dependent methyltransferase [Chitinophagaceae bacterium]|nr:SAM-dependent methyltransferase [Chitinophagaceae bacterium]
MQTGIVYLIPTILSEDKSSLKSLPAYITDAIKDCQVFFVENERSARRFFKKCWKEMVIDDYEWFTIHKAEESIKQDFIKTLKEGKNVGIVSEAGCPGIADPGQILVEAAQEENIIVKPLVGPSSILLALMASGMNGQQFSFNGYLPVDPQERKKKIRELETLSAQINSTQIFIETPYRNNSLINDMQQVCKPQTKLCIAYNITGEDEKITTKTIQQWKEKGIALEKKPAIFLLQG